MIEKTPWFQAKIAFDCDDNETFWLNAEIIEKCLPDGWEIYETDISGAAGFVAIFDCYVLPTIEDGKTVEKLVKKYSKRIEE